MSFVRANWSALPAETARIVARAAHRDDEVVDTAKDGVVINGLSIAGRSRFFHSRYAARREADRLADAAGRARYVVAIGLGMGYHVARLCDRGTRVLVVEPDAALVRTAFEHVDFHAHLERGELRILTGDRLGELEECLARFYVPAIHGSLTVVELPGRVGSEPAVFEPLRGRLTEAVDTLKADLAIQARFGYRWMRNALLNLASLTPRPLPDWHARPAIVAAAGPSLTDDLQHLRARGDAGLLAVDTALPVLLAHGVTPDLIVSIDCQLTSYHHFLSAGNPDVPVAAELSLAPSVFGHVKHRIPLLSAHPLHRLLDVLGLHLPYIDVRGGNVSQAAVDLAVRLGARRVTLVGADFSYPDGETYPRGSYVHRVFRSRADRLKPLAGAHYAFLLDRPGITPDPERAGRWQQPLLTEYAKSMGRFAATVAVPFERIVGRGIAVQMPAGGAGATGSAAGGSQSEHASAATVSPREVLERADNAFAPLHDLAAFEAALSSDDPLRCAAARALLPLLTHLRSRDGERPARDTVAEAITVTRELIAHARASAGDSNPTPA